MSSTDSFRNKSIPTNKKLEATIARMAGPFSRIIRSVN